MPGKTLGGRPPTFSYRQERQFGFRTIVSMPGAMPVWSVSCAGPVHSGHALCIGVQSSQPTYTSDHRRARHSAGLVLLRMIFGCH